MALPGLLRGPAPAPPATATLSQTAGHGQLRLWADGRALHCQVSDPGRAPKDLTRPDVAAWSREHGHGLWMIDQLADKVTLDRRAGGITVTMTFITSSPS